MLNSKVSTINLFTVRRNLSFQGFHIAGKYVDAIGVYMYPPAYIHVVQC